MPSMPDPESSLPLVFDILRSPEFESFLKNWAGQKIFRRGLEYFQQNRVSNLNIAKDGKLSGSVKGRKKYTAALYLDEEDNLAGDCTCPYDDICKHIVALALYARNSLQVETPDSHSEDPDLSLDLESDAEAAPALSLAKLSRALARLSHEKLLELLVQGCKHDEEFALMCAVAADPGKLGLQALINDVHKAIKIAGIADFDDVADYSLIARKLELIAKLGKPAVALQLAMEVFDTCPEVIESYDYFGTVMDDVCEIAAASVDFLELVDWEPARKLMWAIRARLRDSCDYTEPLESYFEKIRDPELWAAAASYLDKARVQNPDLLNDPSLIRLSKMALEKAGKSEALLKLYVTDAQEKQSYLQLVDYLLQQEDYAAAEAWIRKGIEAARFPYQACELRERLIQIREKEKDYVCVIILRTESFVEAPDKRKYQDCANAAKKAKCWPVLKPLLLQYLAVGKLPWLDDTWPWEQKGAAAAPPRLSFPLYYELIELSILEKRPLDALRWHDQQRASGEGRPFPETAIAEAIRDSAPERALAIWQREVERLIDQTKAESYSEAGKLVRKMYDLHCKLGDRKPLFSWLVSLRECNKRKKNFIKVLDAVERSFD